MAMYFSSDVDAKIAEYMAAKTPEEKNKIFETGIRPAFVKLIDSQMYLYHFYKIDDPDMLKNECLSNIYEILPKFDPSKNKKAFSYFNVVVKNWFVGKIREKKKRQKQESENFFGIDHEVVKNDPSIVLQSYEDEILQKEFWVELHRDMDKWEDTLEKEQEIKVLRAIIFVLQNSHLVSIYNKKAVYLYIREMTGLTMKQVNHNMNKLRGLYLTFRERFHSGEEAREEE